MKPELKRQLLHSIKIYDKSMLEGHTGDKTILTNGILGSETLLFAQTEEAGQIR